MQRKITPRGTVWVLSDLPSIWTPEIITSTRQSTWTFCCLGNQVRGPQHGLGLSPFPPLLPLRLPPLWSPGLPSMPLRALRALCGLLPAVPQGERRARVCAALVALEQPKPFIPTELQPRMWGLIYAAKRASTFGPTPGTSCSTNIWGPNCLLRICCRAGPANKSAKLKTSRQRNREGGRRARCTCRAVCTRHE